MHARPLPSPDFLAAFGGRPGVVATAWGEHRGGFGRAGLFKRLVEADTRARQLRRLDDLEPGRLADRDQARAEILAALRKG